MTQVKIAAARWLACEIYGFPVRNQSAANPNMLWTVNGEAYGATPGEAVDAMIELKKPKDWRPKK